MSSKMHWKAVYDNGVVLDGRKTAYEKLDRTKLIYFDLFRGTERVVRIALEDGRQLVYRRRVIFTSSGTERVIHVAGWVKKIGDEYVLSLCYADEYGNITFAGAFDDLVLRPEEKGE